MDPIVIKQRSAALLQHLLIHGWRKPREALPTRRPRVAVEAVRNKATDYGIAGSRLFGEAFGEFRMSAQSMRR